MNVFNGFNHGCGIHTALRGFVSDSYTTFSCNPSHNTCTQLALIQSSSRIYGTLQQQTVAVCMLSVVALHSHVWPNNVCRQLHCAGKGTRTGWQIKPTKHQTLSKSTLFKLFRNEHISHFLSLQISLLNYNDHAHMFSTSWKRQSGQEI